MEKIKNELDVLKIMSDRYFRNELRENFYNVDNFVNEDRQVYKEYIEIQKKFKVLSNLIQSQKQEYQDRQEIDPHMTKDNLEKVMTM